VTLEGQTQQGAHNGQGMDDGHELVLPVRQENPSSVEAQGTSAQDRA